MNHGKSKSVLLAIVLCVGAAPLAQTETLTIQSLQVAHENRISNEEFHALVAARINTPGRINDELTSSNFGDEVTAGNFADEVTSSNFADEITAGNFADEVTAGNFGKVVVDEAVREAALPSPQMAP